MFLLEQFLNAIGALWHLGFKLLFIAAVYLIPVFIAYYRKLKKIVVLSIINIFLGWTFIAWVACIVWAIVGKPKDSLLDKSEKETVSN